MCAIPRTEVGMKLFFTWKCCLKHFGPQFRAPGSRTPSQVVVGGGGALVASRQEGSRLSFSSVYDRPVSGGPRLITSGAG